MSENCSGSCSSCSSDCESRKGPQIVRNANNGKVKKVIAVVSGKGGVGKSLVTSMLAVKANKEGKKAAILDADITGPSIPKQVSGEVYSIILTLSALMPSIFIRVIISILLKNLF